MIYVVKCDDEILYNEFIDGRELASSDFHQIDNEFGSFYFSFYNDHPLYNYIVPKKSKIKIYKDGQLKWLGRAVEQKDSISGERFVYCEGCISYLKDSVIRPFDFTGSPEELFSMVLTQHNSQVSSDQQLVVGNCTVVDPNNTIVRSSIYYLTTWTVFQEKLLNLGGHLVVTFDALENPILNWYANINNYSTQKIKFGENLVDFEKQLLYSDFYTACIPLGAKDENDVYLTISSVNDGEDYLVNDSLASAYGIFYAPTENTTWDDVTVATNLKTKGQNWLSNVGVKYKDVVDLSAEDISFLVDENVTDFYFLKNVNFVTHSGVELSYLIVDFYVDVRNPYSVNIVLSNEDSKYMNSSLTTLNNRLNEASVEKIRTVESEVVSQSKTEALINTLIQQSTYISQQANEIVASALSEYSQTSDLAQLVNTLQAELTILSNGINVSFSNVLNMINLQGESIDSQGQLVESTFNKYDSWFRFIPASQTTNAGLVIGQSNSEIQVKIESGVIYFCTDPDNVNTSNAIAYFSSGKLYVNFINVQNLTIGMTGKWLDVRIVGTGVNTCALFSGRLS